MLAKKYLTVVYLLMVAIVSPFELSPIEEKESAVVLHTAIIHRVWKRLLIALSTGQHQKAQ